MRRLLLLGLLFFIRPVQACTLWGAVGEAAGGGTLLAKNRDWQPDHVQSVRLVHPKQGAAYVGLYADDGSVPGLKAGANEFGLSVVGAMAGSLSREEREAQGGTRNLIGDILRKDHHIADVLARAEQRFSKSGPVFLLISDHSQLLQVEIGKDGRYTLQSQSQRVMSHTNHYLSDELADCNYKIGKSSETRLARIRSLLTNASAPYRLNDFATFSQDQNAGPDNSLWRVGREHTLASWQIATPANAPPLLSIRLANPKQPQLKKEWRLDQAFWQGATRVLLPAGSE